MASLFYYVFSISLLRCSFSYYLVYDNTTDYNWIQAQAYCNETYGTNLATAVNQTQLDRLISMRDAVFSYNVYMFIGLNDRNQEGVYEWISGEPCDAKANGTLCVTYWKPNEPNDGGGSEDCVELIYPNIDDISYVYDMCCECKRNNQFFCDAIQGSPPTAEPTIEPTSSTNNPTNILTSTPTEVPTGNPTPTSSTNNPTNIPTTYTYPTKIPSSTPTEVPTGNPNVPSFKPSTKPTLSMDSGELSNMGSQYKREPGPANWVWVIIGVAGLCIIITVIVVFSMQNCHRGHVVSCFLNQIKQKKKRKMIENEIGNANETVQICQVNKSYKTKGMDTVMYLKEEGNVEWMIQGAHTTH